MRIGFTGTREALPTAQHRALGLRLLELRRRGAEYLHHGDCVGADSLAHDIAHPLGYKLVIHPPIKEQFRAFRSGHETRGARGYWARNRDIVSACDELVACIRAGTNRDHWRRSGTWYTVCNAELNNVRVHLIYPDGSEEVSEAA